MLFLASLVQQTNIHLQPSLMAADKQIFVHSHHWWLWTNKYAAITDGCGQANICPQPSLMVADKQIFVRSHLWWLRTNKSLSAAISDGCGQVNLCPQPSLMAADEQMFVRSHHWWLRTSKSSSAAITDGCGHKFAFENQNSQKCSLLWKNGKWTVKMAMEGLIIDYNIILVFS